MLFESVFDSLTEVKESVESGRVSKDAVVVNLDKNSVGVFLENDEQYFEWADDSEYFMSPNCKYEKQCLFYGEYGSCDELLLELLSDFLCGVENVNYRTSNRQTSHL